MRPSEMKPSLSPSDPDSSDAGGGLSVQSSRAVCDERSGQFIEVDPLTHSLLEPLLEPLSDPPASSPTNVAQKQIREAY